jgi:hypothetical protein
MSEQLTLLDDLGGENDGLGPKIVEAMAKHSGRYIRERNPKLYAAIKLMVHWGVPHETIADSCDVGCNTVAAIANDVSELSLEDHKRVMIAGLRRLSMAATNRLIQEVESGREIPAQALAVILGISVEKTELLSGGATHRVERVLSPDEEALKSFFLSGLASRGQGKVFGAENVGGNAGGVAGLDSGSVSGPGLILDVVAGDNKSPVYDAVTIDNA